MHRGLAAVVTFGVLAVVACGGSQPQAQSTSTSAPAAQAGAAPTGEFGVPECDEYIRKYLACVDSKVPESARGMVRQQIEQTKASWKQAASTESGKAALATGCRQATEAARAAVQVYGCTW